MDWNTVDEAALRFDGGPRSFPPASDATFAFNWPYEPPNEDYEKLFFRQAVAPSSPRHENAYRPFSCGWLIPDETSLCKPVFVAHSLLSAIWLVRASLPNKEILSDSAWASLASAAEKLSQQGFKDPPPSTRKSGHDTVQHVQKAVLPQESLSPSGSKRAASPGPSLSAKRTQTTGPQSQAAQDLSRMSSPQLSDSSEPEEFCPQEPALVTTVSNNNRRAERTRTKKLEASLRKKRLHLGLVEPSNAASRQEQAAYASIAQQDEPLVAWIIKQPISDKIDFYNAARKPYFTASAILTRARALGNQSSRYHAAQFLQAWRERGSPFRGSGGLAASQGTTTALSQLLRSRDAADKAFCFAWDMCDRSEGELAAVHIEYRWAAALLGQAYINKVAQIRQKDLTSSNDRTRNRYGKGTVRKEAFEDLLQLVSPKPTDTNRLVFQKRLAKAARWYTVSQTLGWGSLTLMPYDEIPNSWIESTLRVGELNVWFDLVKKENPDVYAASKALDSWLGPEGIAGGSISEKKTLSIEAEAPATIYEIEEVQDSEDEEASGSIELSQTQVPPSSPIPALSLRQMTLLELFHPIE